LHKDVEAHDALAANGNPQVGSFCWVQSPPEKLSSGDYTLKFTRQSSQPVPASSFRKTILVSTFNSLDAGVSENRVAGHVSIGETVYVRYNPFNSEPEKVERLDGSTQQVLFDTRNYPFLGSFLW
jgi:hypothetical protein